MKRKSKVRTKAGVTSRRFIVIERSDRMYAYVEEGEHHAIAELSRVKDGMKRVACEVLDHECDLQECLKNNSYIVVELKDENGKDS